MGINPPSWKNFSIHKAFYKKWGHKSWEIIYIICAKRIHSNFEHNSEKCTPAFCQTLYSVVAKLSFISPFSAILWSCYIWLGLSSNINYSFDLPSLKRRWNIFFVRILSATTLVLAYHSPTPFLVWMHDILRTNRWLFGHIIGIVWRVFYVSMTLT